MAAVLQLPVHHLTAQQAGVEPEDIVATVEPVEMMVLVQAIVEVAVEALVVAQRPAYMKTIFLAAAVEPESMEKGHQA
jgi:hypothetical protein